MRKLTRALILVTGMAGLLFGVSFYTDYISNMWMFITFLVLLGVVIITWFEVPRRTKQRLAKLVFDGEQIKARLTTESWDACDRYDNRITEWDTLVKKCLTKVEYDLYNRSNMGIEKPENETIMEEGDVGKIRMSLRIHRNYMHIRILRLKEIINKL